MLLLSVEVLAGFTGLIESQPLPGNLQNPTLVGIRGNNRRLQDLTRKLLYHESVTNGLTLVSVEQRSGC